MFHSSNHPYELPAKSGSISVSESTRHTLYDDKQNIYKQKKLKYCQLMRESVNPRSPRHTQQQDTLFASAIPPVSLPCGVPVPDNGCAREDASCGSVPASISVVTPLNQKDDTNAQRSFNSVQRKCAAGAVDDAFGRKISHLSCSSLREITMHVHDYRSEPQVPFDCISFSGEETISRLRTGVQSAAVIANSKAQCGKTCGVSDGDSYTKHMDSLPEPDNREQQCDVDYNISMEPLNLSESGSSSEVRRLAAIRASAKQSHAGEKSTFSLVGGDKTQASPAISALGTQDFAVPNGGTRLFKSCESLEGGSFALQRAVTSRACCKFSCHLCGRCFDDVYTMNAHVDYFHRSEDALEKSSANFFAGNPSFFPHSSYPSNAYSGDMPSSGSSDTLAHRIITAAVAPWSLFYPSVVQQSINLKSHKAISFYETDDSDFNSASYHASPHLGSTSSRLQLKNDDVFRQQSLTPVVDAVDGKVPMYHCNLCKKDYASRFAMLRHLDFHADKRPFHCQVCSYRSKTKLQMKVHLMRHEGYKDYRCDACDYYCVTPSDLNRHIKSRSHRTRQKFACKRAVSVSNCGVPNPCF